MTERHVETIENPDLVETLIAHRGPVRAGSLRGQTLLRVGRGSGGETLLRTELVRRIWGELHHASDMGSMSALVELGPEVTEDKVTMLRAYFGSYGFAVGVESRTPEATLLLFCW